MPGDPKGRTNLIELMRWMLPFDRHRMMLIVDRLNVLWGIDTRSPQPWLVPRLIVLLTSLLKPSSV